MWEKGMQLQLITLQLKALVHTCTSFKTNVCFIKHLFTLLLARSVDQATVDIFP